MLQNAVQQQLPSGGNEKISPGHEEKSSGHEEKSTEQGQEKQQLKEIPINVPIATPSFYKRELLEPAIAFSTPRGREIFQDALALGFLEGFFPLIEQFRTQDEPAFCGLASVAMVLNSLSIDPRRRWKGPWRIFHEKMLDCCIPLDIVKKEGITLQQAACLTRCNGGKVNLSLHGEKDFEEFKETVMKACSTGEYHVIVSYSRRALNQTGGGHFSPVAGYSPSHDLALILDTARFKYPPHWVPLEILYEAMAEIDPVTNKPRGFMTVESTPVMDSVLFTLEASERWEEARASVHRHITGCTGADAWALMQDIVDGMSPTIVNQFISTRNNSSCKDGACIQEGAIDALVSEMKLLPLYKEVVLKTKSNQIRGDLEAEKLCAILLLFATDILDVSAFRLAPDQHTLISAWFDIESYKIVHHEIKYLKKQFVELQKDELT